MRAPGGRACCSSRQGTLQTARHHTCQHRCSLSRHRKPTTDVSVMPRRMSACPRERQHSCRYAWRECEPERERTVISNWVCIERSKSEKSSRSDPKRLSQPNAFCVRTFAHHTSARQCQVCRGNGGNAPGCDAGEHAHEHDNEERGVPEIVPGLGDGAFEESQARVHGRALFQPSVSAAHRRARAQHASAWQYLDEAEEREDEHDVAEGVEALWNNRAAHARSVSAAHRSAPAHIASVSRSAPPWTNLLVVDQVQQLTRQPEKRLPADPSQSPAHPPCILTQIQTRNTRHPMLGIPTPRNLAPSISHLGLLVR